MTSQRRHEGYAIEKEPKVRVYGHRPRQQLSTTQFRQPSASHPIGDQGAFIFSDCPTDLEEERIMRIIIHGAIEKLHLTPVLCEFLNHEHLMDIVAGQAIGRREEDALEDWGFLPNATTEYSSAYAAQFAFLIEKRTRSMWHVDFAIFTHLCSVEKAKRVRDSPPIANSCGRRKRPPL